MNNTGVLIIGGNVQGLGLLRAFSSKGIQTVLINNRKFDVANFSKYSKNNIILRDMNEPKVLYNLLIKLGKSKKYYKWVLIPTNDSYVYTLSKYRSELQKDFTVSSNEWNIVKNIYNKKFAYLLAEKNDIPIPTTYFPKDIDDLNQVADNMEFPCILKPAVMHKFYDSEGKKVLKVNTKVELKHVYNEMVKIIPKNEIMIQEIIPGIPSSLYSYGGFFSKKMKINAVISHERQIPRDFGVSTYIVTKNIEEIKNASETLLEIFRYEGFCEVEFIKDPRDNVLKFLEINPRSWKQVIISEKEKYSITEIAYNYYIGKTNNIDENILSNIKWVHFWQDLYISIIELVCGNASIKEILSAYVGNTIFAVASKNDPIPFIIEPFTYIHFRIIKHFETSKSK